jgi:hypothetical protein
MLGGRGVGVEVEGVELEMGQARLSRHPEAQAFQMALASVKPMGRSSFRVRSACFEADMEQQKYLDWLYCRDWWL